MAWIYVIVAGLLEIVGVNYMNLWQVKKDYWIIVKMMIFFFISLGLLNLAMRDLSMSVTYAVWSGIGSVGGVILGIIRYNEGTDWKRMACISCILISVVGLKLVS